MKRKVPLIACVCIVSLLTLSCESQEKKIELLTVQLNDDSVEVRRSAAIELAKIRKPDTIPALMKALNDESERVYSIASEGLVKIGPPAIPALIRAFRDDFDEDHQDAEARAAYTKRAYAVLMKIGKPAVLDLTEALNREDASVRRYTIEILAKIGEPAIPVLIKMLSNEARIFRSMLGLLRSEAYFFRRENVMNLSYISDALGEIGEPAVEVLIKALNSEFIIERAYAAN